jgi:hypothetical protein
MPIFINVLNKNSSNKLFSKGNMAFSKWMAVDGKYEIHTYTYIYIYKYM